MKTTADLRVYWSKRERDLIYYYQNRESKALGSVLSWLLERTPTDEGKTFRESLEARGYDITTLRISVRKKVT